MHNKLEEWLHHPLSKILIKILEEKKEQTYQKLLVVDKEELEKLRERLQIYHSILDLESLFEGELEEVDDEI